MAAQDSKTCPGPVQKDKSLLMCLIHHPFFPEECLLNFEPNLYFSIRIIFSATKLISFESKHEICMHILPPTHTPAEAGNPSREALQGNPPGKLFVICFYDKMLFLVSWQRFFMFLTCSWVFLPKTEAERSWNHIKKLVLEPRCAVMVNKTRKTVVKFVAGL